MSRKLFSPIILFGLTVLALIAAACSLAPQPADPASTPETALITQEAEVDEVNVEVSGGSAVKSARVIVSGTLPDTCAQLGAIETRREGATFHVRLITHSSPGADCHPERLPFRIELPFSLAGLPATTYEVIVNGVSVRFDPRTVPASDEPALAQVNHVGVEIGVGSPIPVDVVASGSWPDLCAQLSEIRQQIQDSRIEITLLTTPADPNCPPDYIGLPFRIAIPLNGVELPAGTYTVVVNGVSTTFTWPAAAGP